MQGRELKRALDTVAGIGTAIRSRKLHLEASDETWITYTAKQPKETVGLLLNTAVGACEVLREASRNPDKAVSQVRWTVQKGGDWDATGEAIVIPSIAMRPQGGGDGSGHRLLVAGAARELCDLEPSVHPLTGIKPQDTVTLMAPDGLALIWTPLRTLDLEVVEKELESMSPNPEPR